MTAHVCSLTHVTDEDRLRESRYQCQAKIRVKIDGRFYIAAAISKCHPQSYIEPDFVLNRIAHCYSTFDGSAYSAYWPEEAGQSCTWALHGFKTSKFAYPERSRQAAPRRTSHSMYLTLLAYRPPVYVGRIAQNTNHQTRRTIRAYSELSGLLLVVHLWPQ